MSDALLPVVDLDSAPFWAAVHSHRLEIQRCDDCGDLPLSGQADLPVLP